MELKEALSCSQISQAGLYDSDGSFVLAEQESSLYVFYMKNTLIEHPMFGGMFYYMESISPSIQLLCSNEWQPIKPI